jgi:hypothetical protein
LLIKPPISLILRRRCGKVSSMHYLLGNLSVEKLKFNVQYSGMNKTYHHCETSPLSSFICTSESSTLTHWSSLPAAVTMLALCRQFPMRSQIQSMPSKISLIVIGPINAMLRNQVRLTKRKENTTIFAHLPGGFHTCSSCSLTKISLLVHKTQLSESHQDISAHISRWYLSQQSGSREQAGCLRLTDG